MSVAEILGKAAAGGRVSDPEAQLLSANASTEELMAAAATIRDAGHGDLISYSRKVFIPLTQLCRDSCHYCTFAHPPRAGESAYLTRERIVEIAAAGARAGCKEALFTLGDKPELRYRAARAALDKLGHASTLSYLAEMAALVLKETGLLPHINAGVMDRADIETLRKVSVSQGLMLESTSERLLQKGAAHYGSPDKVPAARLATIETAGLAKVPFTSGILIGIGETPAERIDALTALRASHERHGHIQEIIVQNFRAKADTKMSEAAEPELDAQLRTVALARIIFGAAMNLQSPPNLRPGELAPLIAAGVNDWGGVSPVTPDHVNPEAPWPQLEALAHETGATGKRLVERLAVYPRYLIEEGWIEASVRGAALRQADADHLARTNEWVPGADTPIPAQPSGWRSQRDLQAIDRIIDRTVAGETLAESEIVRLFAARGEEFDRVCAAADRLRAKIAGATVTYVVNRNINYTNVCYFRCTFCAFSKGKLSANLRGRPYDLDPGEVERRSREAWERGATEICLQGGIHPEYTGETYLAIARTVKQAAAGLHVHAFSPLEVWQGAKTLNLSLTEFLTRLKAAGLGSLPGTAAEILDDEVRQIICPDKINTAQWFEVMETAHKVGLRSTATIMFGHVDRPVHWARHLLRLRTLQARTGGFTEFVPLPFVPMETPIFLRAAARRGPTYRESVLMHAVARLALHPHFPNIQASWVKMGPEGVAACLRAGANDIGGTLMNETITRSAGAIHGQEMPPAAIAALAESIGRTPRQRTTLYGEPPQERVAASFNAAPLSEPVNTPARRYERSAPAALDGVAD